VGVVITNFDIDRHEIGLKIVDEELTINKILSEHGEECSTYKLAKKVLADKEALVRKYATADRPDVVDEENEYAYDEDLDYLLEDFRDDLRNEYLSMLRKEWKYLTSEEQIIETIKANGWTFTAEGKLEN